MGHPRPHLSVFGRQLLVARVEVLGWPVAHAAAMQGISPATAYKWLRRHRAQGDPGLLDRSSRPRRSPRALSADQAPRRWRPATAPLTPDPGLATQTGKPAGEFCRARAGCPGRVGFLVIS